MNKFNLLVFILLVFLCCGVINKASAQNIPNGSSINVDNLTDQQIKQLMQQAQSSGLSDVQLLQQAQAKGWSNAQIQKLQARINDIRSKGAGGNRPTDTVVMGGRKPSTRIDTLDTTAVRKDIFASLKPKIFGADFFKNKNNSFEPNLKLATPVNYIIGPDDQLNISIYGNSMVNWSLNVSPDGTINIPGVGILNVGGKTIENATSLIKSKLTANNYAIGKGTNVQITLGNIRSIKVIMIGQLQRPGTYTLSSLATVFNALYTAGGPTENGSLRQIEVIRNNKIVSHLDVYDFLVKGSQKNNIALQDQDIVRVPSYRTRVELAGEIKIPALFEVIPGETLQNIIDYAGGFTDSAYTARIKVSQIKDQQRTLTDIVEADYKNYIPLRGDKYTVESVINRFENRVIIKGAVFRPGEYELQKGLTLAQLIKNAAGVKEDAFMDRGTITRLKPDNNRELIPFNLKDVINNVVTIPLQREDSVNISSIFDLRDKYKITINGSVRKTGDFAYADSMKVEDLIIKAGGFAEGASSKRIEVARRIYNADPQSKSSKIANVFSVDVDSQLKLDNINFVLKPFDIVSVYSLPGFQTQSTVKVEGEVLYPGNYTIQKKNEKVSDLIARAGGLTASADVEGGTLKRSNITILGGGDKKSKIDTAALEQERMDRLSRLKKSAKDSTSLQDAQRRNDYVGIDLKKILNNPGSNIDLIVEDRDVIRVPKQQQIVRVNGEVLYPSAVVYDSGKSFNDYVLNAGGFSADALKKRAYVVYPNGTVRGTRKIFFFNSHPNVKPGSEIYVPKKPAVVGNTAQEVLGFATGIASLGAIIFELISISK
jgi:protein involved in polysaccharide export with SLBB domain